MHTGFVDDKSPAEDELAALRRRAYGPDADIAADPRAQARLAELERHKATQESGAPAVARTAPPIGRATEVDPPPTVETAHGASAASDTGDGADSWIAATPAAATPSASAPGRMRRALPWVIAAGAGVVAIALGAVYVDAVTEPLVTEPPVTTPLPLLSEHADGVTLDPGMYVVDDFGAPSSATMAPVLQVPDGYFAIDGSGVMASWSQVVWLFRIESVYTHPCDPGGRLKDVGPSVADLANALAAQPMRDGTDPVPITIGGYDGLYVELSTPDDISTCRKGLDEKGASYNYFYSWPGRQDHATGIVDLVWIVDVQGQRITFDVWYQPDATTPEHVDELKQIVTTATFAQREGAWGAPVASRNTV